jgi:REP element-mobilizing transposase RayT
MKSFPFSHRRNSNRLNGYDYTQPGAYFVTIVTQERFCLFGDVINGKMILNPYGKIANDQWMRLNDRFLSNDFSSYVIMPNHVHGVIFMKGAGVAIQDTHNQSSSLRPYPGTFVISGSLGASVRVYKASVSLRINHLRSPNITPIWQRNYYDHIVRDEHDLENIWKYIDANPQK